jgi:hypothetical protein
MVEVVKHLESTASGKAVTIWESKKRWRNPKQYIAEPKNVKYMITENQYLLEIRMD